MLHNEFSLIAHYFNLNRTSRLDVKLGIGDDCALLNMTDKQILAISADTLVCGQHFLPNINSDDLAFKALAINISDLAATGADPAWLMLALTLPEINESWLKVFSNMLFEQLNYYNMQLIGGDTTAGPMSLTLVAIGFVSENCVLKRSGANPGDWIYVTGTVGDSAVGLAILQKKIKINNTNDVKYLIGRHLRPTPRIIQSKVLRNYASSAIDISDGLISDLNHILHASNVGAQINLDKIPISMPMRRHFKFEQALHWALSGGEDYELCFTVSESNRNVLDSALSNLNISFTCIGRILEGKKEIRFIKNGIPISINLKGFDHFN